MTFNGEMAVIVRYPTEFGSHVKLCLALGLGAFWYWFGLCLDLHGLVLQFMVMHYAFGHKTA